MESDDSAPQAARHRVTWDHFRDQCQRLAARHSPGPVYGVPTGGSLVAMQLGSFGFTMVDQVVDGVLIVDDLVDSGQTISPYQTGGYTVDALYRKPHSPPGLAPDALEVTGWLELPWEHETAPETAVVRLLEYLGEDPGRDGLQDTPKRVCRSLAEMTAGYQQDPGKILDRTFDVECDEMVVLRGIRFASLCEHHLVPFTGTADVAYIPKGRVVGISKLARVVECFARRLQVQERLTQQVAEAIDTSLSPIGVAVVIRAHHHCMGCRGVRQPEAEMVTSAMLGVMRTDAKARQEALGLIGR